VDGTVQVWSLTDDDDAMVVKTAILPLTALAWSPDGSYLALGVEQQVQIRSVEHLEQVAASYDQRALVHTVAWSPRWSPIRGLSTATLASGGEDALVHVWHPGRTHPLLLYLGHGSPVPVAAWSPDGQFVASGDAFTVQVWAAADGSPVFSTPPSRAEGAPAISWRPQRWGTGAARHLHLAVTGFEATVEIWDVVDKRKLWLYKRHKRWGLAVAWSPNGAKIASGGYDQQLQVWEPV
jgi:WD40 repeat protein